MSNKRKQQFQELLNTSEKSNYVSKQETFREKDIHEVISMEYLEKEIGIFPNFI